MSVTMICPNLKCGRTITTPDSARGKTVRCGHCQTLFLVPREPRESAPDAGLGDLMPPNDQKPVKGR